MQIEAIETAQKAWEAAIAAKRAVRAAYGADMSDEAEALLVAATEACKAAQMVYMRANTAWAKANAKAA